MWALAFSVAFAKTAGDEVTSLPGWNGPLPSRQFSGYLSVGPHKHLHYWLVEAESSPATAPVVLWLNGGPGCSSLDGFIYEHGPFRTDPTDATKLIRFEQTWASVANMLYLEAPAGVGFSYSTDAADYDTNDDKTAADSAEALQAFFAAFPQYASNDFFITGESCNAMLRSNRRLMPNVFRLRLPELSSAVRRCGSLRPNPVGSDPRFGGQGSVEGRHTPRHCGWCNLRAAFELPPPSSPRKMRRSAAERRTPRPQNGCSGTEVGVCGGQRWIYDTQYLLGTAFVDPSLKKAILASCNFGAAAPSDACQVAYYLAAVEGL